MAVVFLFVKQKTAYELRISDWSSDVCSSDLRRSWFGSSPSSGGVALALGWASRSSFAPFQSHSCSWAMPVDVSHPLLRRRAAPPYPLYLVEIGRASCREECVSTVRSRWSREP